jgi:hypothetical protein
MNFTFGIFIQFVLVFFFSLPGKSLAQQKMNSAAHEEYIAPVNINIDKEIQCFNEEITDARYSISLCADVPYNKKPYKVAHNQQTGHVFLVLQKINPINKDTIRQVFGFYPKKGLPTLFFKTIKSVIKDNSRREYDVSITRELTEEDFNRVVEKSVALSKNIYHINKYNCYEYALFIFNAVVGKDTVPLTHVRFPFIFGWGGSPVGLYKDLEKLKQNGSSLAECIQFGNFLAPVSSTRVLQNKKHKKKRML